MSRYTVDLITHPHYGEDEEAIFGYDEMMDTWFLQAFFNVEHEGPSIWLGLQHREFPTLQSLFDGVRSLDMIIDIETDGEKAYREDIFNNK